MAYIRIEERKPRKLDDCLSKRIVKYAAIAVIGYYFIKGCAGCAPLPQAKFDYRTIDYVVGDKNE
jgi:hypothetical protein